MIRYKLELKLIKNYCVVSVRGKVRPMCIVESEDDARDNYVSLKHDDLSRFVPDEKIMVNGPVDISERVSSLFSTSLDKDSNVRILDTVKDMPNVFIHPSLIELQMCEITSDFKYKEASFDIVKGRFDIDVSKPSNKGHLPDCIEYRHEIIDEQNPHKKVIYRESVYTNKNTGLVECIVIIRRWNASIYEVGYTDEGTEPKIYHFKYNELGLVTESTLELSKLEEDQGLDEECIVNGVILNTFEYDDKNRLVNVSTIPFLEEELTDEDDLLEPYEDIYNDFGEAFNLIPEFIKQAIKFTLVYEGDEVNPNQIYETGSNYFKPILVDDPDEYRYNSTEWGYTDDYLNVIEYTQLNGFKYISRVQISEGSSRF